MSKFVYVVTESLAYEFEDIWFISDEYQKAKDFVIGKWQELLNVEEDLVEESFFAYLDESDTYFVSIDKMELNKNLRK